MDIEIDGILVDNASLEKTELEKRMHKLRKKFEKKMLQPDLANELEALAEGDLRERIAQCEQAILESERAKAGDHELTSIKEQIKELSAPYAEVKQAQRAIAEYCACVLAR